MSLRKNLRNERTSSFNIPMADADAAGYGGEAPQTLPPAQGLPPKSLAMQLKEENSTLREELEDLRQQLSSQTSALAVQDGTLLVHDFQFTPKGLVIPENVDEGTWQEVGNLLFKLEGSLQWLIGDWLVYGDNFNYGDIKKLAESMGRDPQTFYDYANVARSVKISLRNEVLSFNHHRVVAKLPAYQQMQALTYAADQKLSVADFRQWVRVVTQETPALTEGDQKSQFRKTYSAYSSDVKRYVLNKKAALSLSGAERDEAIQQLEWYVQVHADLLRQLKGKGNA